eukprot:TRINITY_DN8814_c1_g1_i2.p1 TRINITY_DN8814_c1_g1~~TRINITY_DN8814_c1_g1_i2.p1  ORF type:complete len:344 (-),score=53.14 TRINITY_DN8814_c1_g1_i2:417-1448(-)
MSSALPSISVREGVLLAGCALLSVVVACQSRKLQTLRRARRGGLSEGEGIGKNEVLRVIATHRSIRKFQRKPVPDHVLAELIETAMRSSTNGNMQTYSMVVTQDEKARRALALIHDNNGISDAPVIVTFVSDWSRMTRWCKLRGGKPGYDNFNAFLTGALDAMVCAQSLALAAESVGLGICFLGSTIWETHRLNLFFELPEHAHVVTSMMLGFPAEDPELRARLPATSHIHWEKYWSPTDQEILDYYADRESEGWHRYMKLYGAPWQEKLSSHKLSNLAQVYTCLKYSGSDFRLWSRNIFESLKSQSFMNNRAASADSKPCPVCKKMSHCLDPDRFGSSRKLF